MDEESALSYHTDLASGSLEEDDDELLAGEFLRRLDTNDLRELRKHFLVDETSDGSRTNSDCTTKLGRAGRPLNKNEFVKAVDKISGSTAYSLSASKVFQKLDFSQRGSICLEEVLDHIINLIGRRVEDSNTFDLIDTNVILQDTPHCKKETIIKVVSIETESSFCYAVLCKYGRVGVYDGTFQLQDSYVVRLGSGDADGENRRCAWLTDGIYLPDADALLLASSDRALHLFDASGLVHAPLCHVTGMRDAPQCMAYAVGRAGRPSILFVGDDKGNVTTMRFLQPKISLFKKKHPDKLDEYYWKEIRSQHDWVTVSVAPSVHQESVHQIAYCPGNETLISCSQDPLTALVIRHVTGRRTPYIFKQSRGIRCFHLERVLGLLATGSNDCVLRLWNPVVTKQPIVSLFGHKTAVVDVLILRHVGSVISCSTDGVIKVWDIEDQCCIQTLSLNFPSFSVLGKTIEFGARSFYPGPSSGKRVSTSTPKEDISLRPATPTSSAVHTEDIRDHHSASGSNVWERRQLLIVCCNHIAMLRVTANAMAAGSGATTPSLLPPPSREQHASVPSPWGRVEVTVSSSPASTRSRSTYTLAWVVPLVMISSFIALILSCIFCPCCLVYKRRKAHAGLLVSTTVIQSVQSANPTNGTQNAQYPRQPIQSSLLVASYSNRPQHNQNMQHNQNSPYHVSFSQMAVPYPAQQNQKTPFYVSPPMSTPHLDLYGNTVFQPPGPSAPHLDLYSNTAFQLSEPPMPAPHPDLHDNTTFQPSGPPLHTQVFPQDLHYGT